jgi:nitronate monooxygenase
MALPEFLSSRLRLPAVAAPLFIISNPDLVIEQCKAGVVGSFPSLNARPIEELERWLQRITSELETYDEAHPDAPAAPFAVNLIVHGSNNRLQEDLGLCVKYKVPIVITSLGAKEFVNEAIHSYGGVVFHDIINNRFARKAIEKGADGLIAVAAGAGGHAGTISPFALVQEIREWFDGPLLLSGSIANGKAILAAQAMGADLAYIGSAFIATEEANAEQAYKQAIVDYNASDIVYSNLFTGVQWVDVAPEVLQQLFVAHDIAVVADPDRLVVSLVVAPIAGVGQRAAGESGDHLADTVEFLVVRFDAPEAAAGEIGRALFCARRRGGQGHGQRQENWQ